MGRSDKEYVGGCGTDGGPVADEGATDAAEEEGTMPTVGLVAGVGLAGATSGFGEAVGGSSTRSSGGKTGGSKKYSSFFTMCS